MPNCPRCSSEYIKRVRRIGLGERLISLLYVYPFRCQLCGHRFNLLQWGVTYKRLPEDRRDYERLSVNFPITYIDGAVEGRGSVLDISMAGCTFQTEARLSLGTILRVLLHLSADAPPVDVEAAVVRNVHAGRAGVEFLRFEKPERERLQRFVRGLIPR